jgi:hypothetical protein
LLDRVLGGESRSSVEQAILAAAPKVQ